MGECSDAFNIIAIPIPELLDLQVDSIHTYSTQKYQRVSLKIRIQFSSN